MINLIFDIGYNVGNLTNLFFRKMYPEAKIIGIDAYDIYTKNPNPNPNVYLYNYLMAEKSGEKRPFYLCKNIGICTASPEFIEKSRHGHFFIGDGTTGIKEIETISLDEMIKRFGNPDIIKIDVENYEYEVVKGLTQKSGEISFEWCEELWPTAQKVVNHLQQIGYSDFNYTFCSDDYIEFKHWKSWNDLDIHQKIVTGRKETFGMIYAKGCK